VHIVAGGEDFDAFCEGGWALVFSSVGADGGATRDFWNIAYADRFASKGSLDPDQNSYQPLLYRLGREYRDEVQGRGGKRVDVIRAKADGIDGETMRLLSPSLVGGIEAVYTAQFASGWSAPDYDGDLADTLHCGELFGVTQHYAACFEYSVGADGDTNDVADQGWGPHILTDHAQALDIATDGTPYTRLGAIRRWTRW
jgi:hypothetical protein